MVVKEVKKMNIDVELLKNNRLNKRGKDLKEEINQLEKLYKK